MGPSKFHGLTSQQRNRAAKRFAKDLVLFALGVDTDERKALGSEAFAQFSNGHELRIPTLREGMRALLVVDPKGEAHLLQEPGHGPVANRDAQQLPRRQS